MRPFMDVTKDLFPRTRTRHRGSRLGKSSCRMQSSRPSGPVIVNNQRRFTGRNGREVPQKLEHS